MTDDDQAELDKARADVDRLLWAVSVSPEAEVRRVESLERAVRELRRLEKDMEWDERMARVETADRITDAYETVGEMVEEQA